MSKKVIPAKTEAVKVIKPKIPLVATTTGTTKKKITATKGSSNRKLIDAMYATASTISENIITKDDC